MKCTTLSLLSLYKLWQYDLETLFFLHWRTIQLMVDAIYPNLARNLSKSKMKDKCTKQLLINGKHVRIKGKNP